jgi:hypothetical protein
MFTLRICTNGQPSIETDTRMVPGYVHYRTDALDFTPKGYAGETVDAIAAVVAEVAPESKTRRVAKGSTLRVRFPASLVAARDAIDADWQTWASEGLSHREMQHRAINHPAFAPYLGA